MADAPTLTPAMFQMRSRIQFAVISAIDDLRHDFDIRADDLCPAVGFTHDAKRVRDELTDMLLAAYLRNHTVEA